MHLHRRRLSTEDVPLSLTPMIDVTFLLLLFFLCTLQFKTLEGKIPSMLPRSGQGSEPRVRDDVLISVRVEGSGPARSVRFGAIGRDYGSLPALVERLRKIPRGASRGIRIRCGEGVLYGDVVSLLDALLLDGWDDVAFVPTRGIGTWKRGERSEGDTRIRAGSIAPSADGSTDLGEERFRSR